MLDIAAAEIGVVLLDARGHIVQGEPVLLQQGRIDNDLKLLGLAAPSIDFADARDGAQLALDHPLVQVLQFHGAHGTGERVLVKLAEGRGR